MSLSQQQVHTPGVEAGLSACFETSTPNWAEGTVNHNVEMLRVSESTETVRKIVAFKNLYNLRRVDKVKEKNQKSYSGDIQHLPFDISGTDVYNEPDGPGWVSISEEGVRTHRHSHWVNGADLEKLKRMNRNNGHYINVISYALSHIKLLIGKYDKPETTPKSEQVKTIATVGNEQEFQIVKLVEGKYVPVDIQVLIKYASKLGLPLTIEGWSSQCEYGSNPTSHEQDNNQIRLKNARGLHLIKELIESFDLKILPTAVMIDDHQGKGMANFGNIHVMKVLTKGIAAAIGKLGEMIPIDEAANILGGFRTCGLHITTGLTRNSENFGSENVQNVISNLTHSRITALLKFATANGNLDSPEVLSSGLLSTREFYRKELPSARVSFFSKYSEAIEDFLKGVAPSLERATHYVIKNGVKVFAGGVHNPSGRQKQDYLNEYTFGDIETNQRKIEWLETLMATFTAVVEKNTLLALEDSNSFESLDQKSLSRLIKLSGEVYPPHLANIFVGLIHDQNEWDFLTQIVDSGEDIITIGEIPYSISEVIGQFVDWNILMSQTLSIEINDRDLEMLRKLKNSFDRTQVAGSFREYLGLEGNREGHGNTALVAQSEFDRVKKEIFGISDEAAYNMVLTNLINAYSEHLEIYRNEKEQLAMAA